MKSLTSRQNWTYCFTLILIFPSLGQLLKYTGIGGFLIYALVIYVLVSHFSRHAFHLFYERITQKEAIILFIFILILMAINFHLIHPLADTGIIGGGNDRGNALNKAAEQILSLQYPYAVRTYLGNPISPLPGAILLAVPFVILGNSGYQNLFWIILFVLVLYSLSKDFRTGLYLLGSLFLLSPIVSQEFLTGGDLIANNLYIFIAVTFYSLLILKGVQKTKWLFPASIFLGIALCSRFQYILLLPLLFSFSIQNTGWKNAFKYTFIAGIVTIILGFSFYLASPAEFTPLHTYEKLSRFETHFPHVGLLVPFLTLLVTFQLCLTSMKKRLDLLFRNCAIILAIPSLAGLLFALILRQHANILTFSDYGLNYLIFGSVYLWYSFHHRWLNQPVPYFS